MKTTVLFIVMLASLFASAQIQQEVNQNTGITTNSISEIDSIRFNLAGDAMEVILQGGIVETYMLSEINSVTFSEFQNCGATPHTCNAPCVHNPDLTYGSMTDQEGNVYKTIVIGTQEWMAENLNTSIYRNGEAIPTNLDNAAWQGTTSGAWAYYNNDASYACPYGKLYNWYTCLDARQLCPVGWHVPTDGEWTVLTDYLGGESVAGGKMKTTGTIEAATGLWASPNAEATNSSGFSGAPGGGRYGFGVYDYFGRFGFWWSSSQFGAGFALSRGLDFSYGNALSYYDFPQVGWSVRCLRD